MFNSYVSLPEGNTLTIVPFAAKKPAVPVIGQRDCQAKSYLPLVLDEKMMQ